MNIIIATGPETPDPTQLDLFDFGTEESEPINSAVSGEGIQANDIMCRSPTLDDPDQPEIGKNFDFNEAQQSFASSLHHKSRELVLKSIEILKAENDLAR